MKHIYMLELSDLVEPTDWCRPLKIISMSGGHSDHFSFKSCYSGRPENNSKWVQVKHIFGKCWMRKSVNNINKIGIPYEFIRGDIPQNHKLNLKKFNKEK